LENLIRLIILKQYINISIKNKNLSKRDKMKISIIVGTRPEIIKMSPIIRICEKKSLNYFILHTGQHYSYEMDKIFFEEIKLPQPKYNLNVGSGNHGKQTGQILTKVEEILITEKPDIVLVEGDTNSVLAGALAASKLHIKVGHIEAGLRSYDKGMPEELNRVITDHISDLLFAPTKLERKILYGEGIKKGVYITGNTIVDAVNENLKIAKQKIDILKNFDLKKRSYILLTIHRQENVDDLQKLKGILDGLALLHKNLGIPIIFPIHPRTKKKIESFNLKIPNGVSIIDPVGFLNFIWLEKNAKLILTDSGGVQEEACILKVPCVTLRENTERPQTIHVGANMLAGTNPKKILLASKKMLEKKNIWSNPFGDGKAGKRIIDIVLNE